MSVDGSQYSITGVFCPGTCTRAPGAVDLARQIHVAYRQYGNRLAEIAEHLGLYAATVSRRLKQPD
jgi:hypothetical protein